MGTRCAGRAQPFRQPFAPHAGGIVGAVYRPVVAHEYRGAHTPAAFRSGGKHSGSPSSGEYVAVILSGPEPQRSILEQKLLEQAMALTDRHFTFVQGKTQGMEHHFVAENVEVVSYLTSRHLNELLLSCQVVVCRSGYSSLMDLAALGNKAILIPTPGQTEQEYLADYFADQGVFVAQRQEEIDLEKGLEAIFSTTGFVQGQLEVIHFKAILEEWLSGQ